MAYIIGTYNKYDARDRAHSHKIFEMNGNWYAIYEVDMCWGLPMLKYQVDQEDRADMYHIYETEEEAQQFVSMIRRFN